MELSFSPTVDPALIDERLGRLLFSRSVCDSELEEVTRRLRRDFHCYASCYPLPLWAPGLPISPEMRSLSEVLFPFAPVRRAFSLLLRKSCRFTPLFSATTLANAPTWLDFLARTAPLLKRTDPSSALEAFALSEQRRRDFIFALFLPRHYGPGFERYPLQSQWAGRWLKENVDRLGGSIRALDSACGSGEGTYRLSELIVQSGYDGTKAVVHGSTFEPFELFAAAHAFFPHDPPRQEQFRRRIAPLLAGGAPRLQFYLDDVASEEGRGGYDLILCNGLLGGPFLHRQPELGRAVAALARRLAPGGVLLAADHFHAGWRTKLPTETLKTALEEAGLVPLEIGEGIAGEKEKGQGLYKPPAPSP